MRAFRTVVALVLTLALSAPVLAADFQAGWKAYARGDYAAAMKEWRPLAERGDDNAQYYLGFMYENGKGVPQDYAEAANWYHLAAEKGLAEAQFSLGDMYVKGKGVTQDFADAVKWYHLAAEQGDAYGQLYLGNMYAKGKGITQDYVQAHMWANLAAAQLQPGLDGDRAVNIRDDAEKHMTPDQVAEAQRLAREWKPK